MKSNRVSSPDLPVRAIVLLAALVCAGPAVYSALSSPSSPPSEEQSASLRLNPAMAVRREARRIADSGVLAEQDIASNPVAAFLDDRNARYTELESIPWEDLARYLAEQGIPLQQFDLCACPGNIGDLEPARVVAQFILNTFYEWEEYDIGVDVDTRVCIVMKNPRPGMLTVDEAQILLTGSSLWRQSTAQLNDHLATRQTEMRIGLQAVMGIDDRTRITDTETFPWNTYCYIECQLGEATYSGTGCIVSPYMVLTCGHNIYDWETASYMDDWLVIPGLRQEDRDGPLSTPYGLRRVVEARTAPAFPSDLLVVDDYGAMFLDRPIPGINTYMPLGFAYNSSVGNTIEIAGYAGEVKTGTASEETNSFALWSASGPISKVYSAYFDHAVDTSDGDSGAPMRRNLSSATGPYPIIAGIHAHFDPETGLNGGPRLAAHNQNGITEWMQWTRNIVFEDTFSSTSISGTRWTSIDGATIDDVGANEPSGQYSLRLNGEDSIRSAIINLSSYSGALLTYYYERTGGGNSTEVDDDLVVEYSTNGTSWTELDRQPGSGDDMNMYELAKIDLPAGALKSGFRLRFRSAGDPPSNDDWFIDDVVLSTRSLPQGWNEVDLGSVPGSSSYNPASGTWTVTGGGTILEGGHFVYTTLKGDGSITARVTDFPQTNVAESMDNAGVMIREDLTAGPPCAAMTLRAAPSSWLPEWYWDSTTGGGGGMDRVQSPQLWIRVQRGADVLSGSYSLDGHSWTSPSIWKRTIWMKNELFIGLVVVSHDPTVVHTVKFDNVSVEE
jgi:V8-like Glu-specific endopeptidase